MQFCAGQTVMRVEPSYYRYYGVKGQKYILTFASKVRLDGYNVETGRELRGAAPGAFIIVDDLKVEDFV